MMAHFSSSRKPNGGYTESGDAEMQAVVADFLETGLVENVISLCKQQPEQIVVCAELVRDERMRVRLGLAVLFEELKIACPDVLMRAVPVLSSLCSHPQTWVRGEAASLLYLIGTPEALSPVQAMQNDPAPQVAALIRDLLSDA